MKTIISLEIIEEQEVFAPVLEDIAEKIIVNTQNLSAGIYSIVFRSDNNIITRQIIKPPSSSSQTRTFFNVFLQANNFLQIN